MAPRGANPFQPQYTARAKSQPASQAPAPPKSGGTWVGDDEPMAPPQPLTEGEGSLGVLDTSNYEGSAMPTAGDAGGYSADGYCPDGSCYGDSCGNGYGYGGHHRRFNDLWAEVHAHRRMWVSADFMTVWAKGNPLPPLVTTSPLGTPQSQAGVLPESATTAILFGNDRVDEQTRYGGRIQLGYWLTDGEFCGIEGGYMTFQNAGTDFDATSNFTENPNAQILARPFVNFDPSLPSPTNDAAIVAFPEGFVLLGTPGTLNGSIDIQTTSQIQSANATFRKLLWIDFTKQRRVDILAGYRFFRLDDSVTINDSSDFVPSGGGIIGPVSFTSQDIFSARNQFHGGELGLKSQSYWGRLSLELIGKIAFGNMHQTMFINGSNTITADDTSVTNVGGLLAQPSNIGSFARDVFAILPEANVNLRWDITRNLRATVGYTFIYTNRVQRSGDAINLNLNPTQINGGTLEGEAQPTFAFDNTTFWLQGISSGVEYRW